MRGSTWFQDCTEIADRRGLRFALLEAALGLEEVHVREARGGIEWIELKGGIAGYFSERRDARDGDRGADCHGFKHWEAEPWTECFIAAGAPRSGAYERPIASLSWASGCVSGSSLTGTPIRRTSASSTMC